jgi:hypothetical protein
MFLPVTLKHSDKQTHIQTTMATQTTTTFTKTEAETYFTACAERMMAEGLTLAQALALYHEKYPDVPTYLSAGEEDEHVDCIRCHDCGKNRDGELWISTPCECGETVTYRVRTDESGEETYTVYNMH